MRIILIFAWLLHKKGYRRSRGFHIAVEDAVPAPGASSAEKFPCPEPLKEVFPRQYLYAVDDAGVLLLTDHDKAFEDALFPQGLQSFQMLLRMNEDLPVCRGPNRNRDLEDRIFIRSSFRVIYCIFTPV